MEEEKGAKVGAAISLRTTLQDLRKKKPLKATKKGEMEINGNIV